MPQFESNYDNAYYLQSQRIQALAAAIQALTPHAATEGVDSVRFPHNTLDGIATLALKEAIRQMKQKLLFD